MKGSKLFKNHVFLTSFIALILFSLFIFLFDYYEFESRNYFDKNGVSRFFFQFIQLIFGLFVILAVSSIINSTSDIRFIISKIRVIFIILLIFGLFQLVAYSSGVSSLLDFHNLFAQSYLDLEINYRNYSDGRLNIFSKEPSHLSIFLVSFGPFILKNRSRRISYYFCVFLFLIICFYTYSRTLYIALLVQSLLFFFFKSFYRITLLRNLYFFPILVLIIILIYLSPIYLTLESSVDIDSSSSSFTRYVASYSAFMSYIENANLFWIRIRTNWIFFTLFF